MIKKLLFFVLFALFVFGCHAKTESRFPFITKQEKNQCLACSLVGIISEQENKNYEEYIPLIDELGREFDAGMGVFGQRGITVKSLEKAMKNIFGEKYELKKIHHIKTVKEYLSKGISIMGIFYTSQQWVNNENGEIYKNEPWKGSHCVILYDIDEEWIYFVNSWGEEWGNNGMGKINLNIVEKYFLMGIVVEQK